MACRSRFSERLKVFGASDRHFVPNPKNGRLKGHFGAKIY